MKAAHRSILFAALLVAAPVLACTTAPPVREMTSAELVERLQGDDPVDAEVAAREAWKAGPEAIPELFAPLTSERPGVRYHALSALETIVLQASDPGAPQQRARASAALVLLIERPLVEPERSEIVRLLGAVVDDRAGVRALAARLSDPATAEAALFALERCPRSDAGTALVEALGRADLALPRRAVVDALGTRRERSAAGELLGIAQRGAPEEAVAARAALSRIGDPRAGELLSDAAESGAPGAGADLLRFAAVRLAAGDERAAAALAAGSLQSALPHERAAALRLVARAGGEEELTRLVSALTDPAADVRGVAREELVGSTAARAARELKEAYETATSSQRRSELLRVIVARSDPAATELLRAAASDTSPRVRLVALELAGEAVDLELEEAVLRGSRSVDASERAIARRSLLAFARAHLQAGDVDHALELYHSLVADGDRDAATVQALAGVAAAARPDSLEVLRPLVGREGLVDDVDRARVAVAAALAATDRATAVAELEQVCTGTAGRGVRRSAAAELRALGVDTSVFARRRGFLTTWYLSGPYPAAAPGELAAHPFGTSGPAFPSGEPDLAPSGEGLPPWRRFVSDDLDGAVDLLGQFDPHDNVSAYALAEIRSDAAVDMLLKLGSDDGVAVWLNGAEVHVNQVNRGLTVDSDQVPVRLREGSNRLLVKVGQGGGDWGLCVRLCSADGEPVDLSR